VSRVEPLARRAGGPDDGLRRAFRAALSDLYYQSIRLVPANVLWGLSFLAVLFVTLGGGPLSFLVLAPLLAIPYAGVVRLATQAARDDDVVLSDVWKAYRQYGLVALGIGAATTLAVAILASNVVLGSSMGGFLGLAFATIAGSGLIAIWTLSFPVWVILVDPRRADRPARARLRLAVLLVFAAPGRCAALALLLGLLFAVSTIAFAALLTVSVAYAGLVSARFLLPLSDRLETWLELRHGGGSRPPPSRPGPDRAD
jgi:uncharacterized membrane protein YesL